MIILSKEDIILLHQDIVDATGGSAEIKDEGMLESALAAPFQTFGGEELFPTIYQKAARLGYGLTSNHPFADGNKRIGAHAMLVFLALNGIELEYEQDELSDLFLDVASDRANFDNVLLWIATHLT